MPVILLFVVLCICDSGVFKGDEKISAKVPEDDGGGIQLIGGWPVKHNGTFAVRFCNFNKFNFF